MTLMWKGWFLKHPLFHFKIPEAAALQLPLQKGGADKHHLCAAVQQDTPDRTRPAHWGNSIRF